MVKNCYVLIITRVQKISLYPKSTVIPLIQSYTKADEPFYNTSEQLLLKTAA